MLDKTIKQHRCITMFEGSIKSKYTRNNYISNLNNFKKFINVNNPEQILLISPNKLQHLLENYLLKLKDTTNPNSIPTKFQGIKHFCIMNNITLNWNIIYKMYPQKQKIQNVRSYTTKEIRELISCTKNNMRDKALIHFLASTGVRIGVFDYELTINHMKKLSSNCYAVKVYAGHIDEYWTFLTPQASKILNKYHNSRKSRGEIFSDCTPIFTTNDINSKQLGWSGSRSVIYRLISKSSVIRNKCQYRYDIQADHGFRKRFNTILKLNNSINYNIAEKLMGHKNGLDGTYFTPTIDELFMEFKKAISDIEL